MAEKKEKVRVEKSTKVVDSKFPTKKVNKEIVAESKATIKPEANFQPKLDTKAQSTIESQAEQTQTKKATTIKEPKLIKMAVKKKSRIDVFKGPTITVKQITSGAGRLKSQIQTLIGLGLNKINKESTLEDTPSIRGMIRKVAHLLQIVK